MTRPDGKSRMDMLDWKAESFLHPDQKTNDGPQSSPPPLILPLRLLAPVTTGND